MKKQKSRHHSRQSENPISTSSPSISAESSSSDVTSKETLPLREDLITPVDFSAHPKQKQENQPSSHTPARVNTPSSAHSQFSSSLFLRFQSFLSDRAHILLILLLLLAFLVRMKYIGQESMWNDAAVHLWRSILVTREPLTFFTREYILGDYTIPQTIMAIFYFFTRNIILSGQIVSMLYSLGGIVLAYLVGKELNSKTTGLIAAGLLAFNHIFLFYSVRPLADSPLLATTLLLLYAMIKLEKEKKVLWGIIAGSLFIIAMFTKVQASVYVFALLLYYLLFKHKEMIKDKAYRYSWLIPVGFIIIAHIFAKILFKAQVIDRIFALFRDFRGMPFGLEALAGLQWIFSLYLIPFILLGIFFVISYKRKEYYFPLILFIFYYLFFEINVDNTQDRYLLPIFSIAVLLAAFAIEEVGAFIGMLAHKHLRLVVILVIVFVIAWNYYQIANPLIYNKSFTYTGYKEAGDWIKENVPENVPIFAGEYRSIRLFSEREFGGPPATANTPGEDNGGTIWNLRSPHRYTEEYTAVGRSNFEKDLQSLAQNNDVYLEVDIWEYAQPPWYWPLTQDSFNYFASLGFKLVKVIEKDILTKNGLKKAPVIFILKKEKETHA